MIQKHIDKTSSTDSGVWIDLNDECENADNSIPIHCQFENLTQMKSVIKMKIHPIFNGFEIDRTDQKENPCESS
jgi:hypothetical protein